MRLAVESRAQQVPTRAAAEKTFRKRQVKASSKSPTGRAFSTMSRGWERKTVSTLRRLLGWVQRQSRV